MRLLKPALAAIAALVPCAAASAIDTVWHQMPKDQLGSIPSLQNATTSVRGADDFLLPTGNGMPYVMSVIRTRMLSTLGASPSSYRMEIYADANGAPGTLLALRTAYLVDGFGVDYRGVPILQVSFFGQCDLPAGQRYWLSVFGVGQGTSGFATYNFGASSPILGNSMYRNAAGNWLPADSAISTHIRDLAFTVSVERQLPVPGPGPLVLAALGGLMGTRRRRSPAN
jgi:hypothetical protein